MDRKSETSDKYNKLILLIAFSITLVLVTLIFSVISVIKLSRDLNSQKKDLALLIRLLEPQIDASVTDFYTK